MQTLTNEQLEVVTHPIGNHSRVLAVAGSGKSTTLASRIKYLVQEAGVSPSSITVLMFNPLARKQFSAHLDNVDLSQNLQPAAHTFHSFSFQVINQAIKIGLLTPRTIFWLSDQAEYVFLSLKRIINDIENNKTIPTNAIGPDQAMHAISLWKGSLVPPSDGLSNTYPFFPQIYDSFEQFRQSKHALTYDDFIPTAINLLVKKEAESVDNFRYLRGRYHIQT